MEPIVVKDKKFVEYISKEEITNIITDLAHRVDIEMRDKNPLYIIMLNGAFIFAADFLRALKSPCETLFLKYSSYSGMTTTGTVQTTDIPDSVKGRNIVILEDIVDSGLTMDVFKKEVQKKNPKSVTLVSMLSKPEARRTQIRIDFIGKEIENKFIVGMGLDYDGIGRNLDAIYVLEEE